MFDHNALIAYRILLSDAHCTTYIFRSGSPARCLMSISSMSIMQPIAERNERRGRKSTEEDDECPNYETAVSRRCVRIRPFNCDIAFLC